MVSTQPCQPSSGKTHASRGLPAISLHAEDLRRQNARRIPERQPVNINRRLRRRGDISRLRANDERVGVAFQTCGSEVPLRDETRRAGGVRDEVVLPEHGGRAEHVERLDDGGDLEVLGGVQPGIVDQRGEGVEVALGDAGEIEELGESTRRTAYEVSFPPIYEDGRLRCDVRIGTRGTACVVLHARAQGDEVRATDGSREWGPSHACRYAKSLRRRGALRPGRGRR